MENISHLICCYPVIDEVCVSHEFYYHQVRGETAKAEPKTMANKNFILYLIDFPLKNIREKTIKDKIKYITKSKNYYSDIIIASPNRSRFLFTLNFNGKKQILIFSLKDKVELYINYLKNKKMAMLTKGSIKEILIESCLKEIKNNNVVDFSLYLMVFRECYMSGLVYDLFNLFAFEKFQFQEQLNKEQYFKILDNISGIDKKPKWKDRIIKELGKSDKETIPITNVLYNTFENILLLSYNKYEFSKFMELFEGKKKKIYLQIIINNPKTFKGIEPKHLRVILHRITDVKTCEEFCKLYPNLNELLKIIIDEYDFISKLSAGTKSKDSICSTKEKSICIHETFPISKDDDIKQILEKYEELVNKQKEEQTENVKIKISVKLWKEFIKLYENYSLECLSLLKYKLSSILSNGYKAIEKNITSAILTTGITMIKEQKLFNNSLLKFILDNPNYNEYKKFMTKNFNLEAADEEFIELWKKINYKQIYDKGYYSFCDVLLNTVKSLEKFNIVFKLFPAEKIDSELVNKIQLRLQKIINNNDTVMKYYLLQIFKGLFKYKELKEENLIVIIKEIQNKTIILSEKEKESNALTSLYSSILSILPVKYALASKEIINNITNNIQAITDPTVIIKIIDTIKQDESTKDKKLENLLHSFKSYIKVNEFYSNEMQSSFKLLQILIREGIFTKKEYSNLSGTQYVHLSKKYMTQIADDLKNKNFTGNELTWLTQDEGVFEEKMNMLEIASLSKNDITKLKEKIRIMGNQYKNDKQNLEDALIYNDFFYPDNEEKKKQIEAMRIMINTEKLSKFDKMKINQLQEISNEGKKYNYKLTSLFFREIFLSEKSKSNDDEKNKQNASKQFESLKKYLFDTGNFKKIPKDLLGIILSTIKERESLLKEFTFLKRYFKKQDVDTSTIEDKMILMASKYKIQTILEALSFFLQQFKNCYQETDFSTMLEQRAKALNKPNENNVDILGDISSELREIDIDIQNQKDFIKILLELRSRDELFKFLDNKTDNDFRHLTEFAGEVDDNCATGNDIEDLINVVNFVNELKNIRNVTDKQFIIEYSNLFNKQRFVDIAINFSQVIKNFLSLKDLYLKVTNKSLISKNVIKDLMNQSKFKIQKQNNIPICTVIYNKDDKKVTFTFEQVQIFRDNVLLKKKDQNDESVDDFPEQCKIFSSNIYQIANVIDLIQELYNMGDIVNYEFDCMMIENEVKVIRNYTEEQLINKLIEELKNRKKEVFEVQKEFYKTNILNTFIFGKLNVLLCDYLLQKKTNTKINNLFTYITQNHYKNQNVYCDDTFSKENYSESKQFFNSYLQAIINNNNISLENLFSEAKIKSEVNGIYSRSVTTTETDKEIIEVVYQLTKKYPIPHAFLMCNEDTSYEEVIAFIYRALYCQHHILFSIYNIDVIAVEKKNSIITEITHILNYYEESKKTIKSLLIFFYSKDGEIIREIKYMKEHHFFNNPEQLSNKIKQNIKIINSTNAGFGKSEYIKGIAQKNQKNYIYFPIGGEIKRDEIIARLLGLEINDDSFIHLDLQDTSKEDKILLMKDFLFNFLILGYYSKDDSVFYLSSNIEVMIEIPNCFYNFLDKFPILKLFDCYTITENNFPPLIAEQSITSNIQIACNYLKNISQIDKIMLNFPGLTIKNDEDSYTNATVLSSEECYTLLKPYIKGFNYYQIKTFINSFSEQMKYLTKTIYLNVHSIETGRIQLKIIRSFIVNSSIEQTKHFTQGAYSDLMNSQMKFYEKFTANFDETAANEKGIENLCNRKPVSFDDIKPSLIFFNDDGQALSIISTCSPDSEEERELTKLLNFQNPNSPEFWDKLTNRMLSQLTDFLRLLL